jgi:transposase
MQMTHIEGTDRDQLTLFPESVDDYIPEDNPVRFLDAFVESLDLHELMFQRVIPSETGRPSYHPGDLLRLFLYGYLNRIRSSRRLESESRRNLELIWLLKRLSPDFKTIADFRKDNGPAIRQVCRQFTLFCRKMNLFGGELVAIDGSKFKAVNARDRNFSKRKVKSMLEEIDQRIEQYLEDIDSNDQKEINIHRPSADEIKTKIAMLKKRKRELRVMDNQMEKTGETQVSLTDPDSRSMPIGKGHGTDVGYNVQVSVDAKHKLILDHEVTNDPTDFGHLSTMAIRSKEILATNRLDAVADKGYYDGQEVAACVEAGITPNIAKPNTSVNQHRNLFVKEDFRYDKRRDCYRCPAGEKLSFRFQTHELGRDIRYYATESCRGCRLRSLCTTNAGGRRITRSLQEDTLDDMQRRIRSHPEKLKRRKGIVEHPFGTIKRSMDQGYFLMRGLKKVRTEMSLTILARC